MPRIVSAGSPGIRWIMKNTTIVTPTATGTSCSSRRPTNDIRPTGDRYLPRVLSRRYLLSQTSSICMLPSGVTKKPCTLVVVAYGYGE